MLKFFRKYNKYILIVGMVMLMVAFLIQGTLSIVMPGPESRSLGTIDGKKIKQGDQHTAAAELEALHRLPPLGNLAGQNAMIWMLMVHDAQKMGLSASDAEVTQVLQAVGADKTVLRRVADVFQASPDFVRQSVRNWLMVEAYRELVLGLAYTQTPGASVQSPGYRRLTFVRTASELQREQKYLDAYILSELARGAPRISEPLVRHLLHDQGARVSGKAVVIASDQYLDLIDPPGDEELQHIFEAYRKKLPGEGEPYGFGYRLPDRVKIEYLTVPLDVARQGVKVDEAEAVDYYEANPQHFVAAGSEAAVDRPSNVGAGSVQPYDQARSQILELLANRKAEALAQRMIKTARAILKDQARPLDASGGYKLVTDAFEPIPLEVVADRIETEYGVRPVVREFDDEWITADRLSELPDIGMSVLEDVPTVNFRDYVLSAKQMNPPPDNPLVPRRLQAKLPGQPMRSYHDGARHLFRLVEVEASAVPQLLAEVREQVERDAQKKAAYDRLREEKSKWLSKAIEQGLEDFANQLGAAVVEVPAMSRRSPAPLGGLTVAPVAGTGASEAFVGAMFEVAEGLADRGGVETAAEADRIGTTALDRRLALAVFRVDSYKSMTRSDYEQTAARPDVAILINRSMPSNGEQDAFSYEAVKKRVGFVPEKEEPDPGAR